MKLTPLDIHQKEFNHALRGYNEAEVDAFLDSVADELERLFKENIDLSEKIDALEEKVRGYQEMERTLHNTLVSAQRSADEIIGTANGEAALVLKDAEVKAKEIIHGALTQKQKAVGDLARIKQAEEEFRAKFKALLETHTRSLGEIALPVDITLMTAGAGEDVIAEVEVASAPSVVAFETEAAEAAQEEPAAPVTGLVAEPGFAPQDTQPIEEADAGFASGLHLGETAEPEIEPDTESFVEPLEFKLPEFGSFGEREDDLDIEEVD